MIYSLLMKAFDGIPELCSLLPSGKIKTEEQYDIINKYHKKLCLYLNILGKYNIRFILPDILNEYRICSQIVLDNYINNKNIPCNEVIDGLSDSDYNYYEIGTLDVLDSCDNSEESCNDEDSENDSNDSNDNNADLLDKTIY